MSFWQFAAGTVQGTLTAAEPDRSLFDISRAGVRLTQMRWLDPLTVEFCCSRREKALVRTICEKRGDDVHFRREWGLVSLERRLIHRPVLVMGFLLLFLLTFFLPTRILFVRVEGNERIPERAILSAAEECGIRFGASRREVRSEKMKNALLSAMPDLKWAGLNTSGCVATISVREREVQEDQSVSTGVSNIVALRDGYITSCTVTRGNGLCVPGQIVQEGQVLISGYTDCGICIQVTQAQGEVFAQTSRDFQAVMPSECLIRAENPSVQKRYCLILGKKRINFWKDSGISDATCGRMYEEYYITLPGGFRLPACIGAETITTWDLASTAVPQESVEEELRAYARDHVLSQTVAGQILREDHSITQEKGAYHLTGRFLCLEMIGRVITEEIGEINGKTD